MQNIRVALTMQLNYWGSPSKVGEWFEVQALKLCMQNICVTFAMQLSYRGSPSKVSE